MAINPKTGIRNDIIVRGFPRGLNNVNDITTLDDEELAICENLELDSNGGLVSRPPIVKIAGPAVSGESMEFLGYYSNTSGIVFVVVSCASGTYIYNLTTNTYTQITTIVGSGSAQYGDKLYVCSRTTSGGYWNGATFTVLGTGSLRMPWGEQLVLHKSRLFMVSRETGSSGSRIFYSRIDSVLPLTSINEWDVFSGSDYFDVSAGDGQSITSLVVGAQEIFIFRNRSTYYFKYDADILSSAVLQLIDSNVGADNQYSVAQYEFSYIVLSNGRLYRFVSYQYYPLNDPMRLEIRPGGGSSGLTIKSAVSTIGRRAILYYGGITYVLNLDDGTWSTWSSPTTQLAYIKIAPRNGNDLSPDTAYGVTGTSTSSFFGIYRLIDTYNTTASEEMTCTMQTKAFDFGSPDSWKRMFYWDSDVYTARDVVGTATPFQLSNVFPSWDDMEAETWDSLSTHTWDSILDKNPDILTTIDYPAPTPFRVNVAFQKDMRFRRCSYKIQLTTDGTTGTGPVRIVSLSIHAVLKKVISTIIQ
jgi:hypothetical protein